MGMVRKAVVHTLAMVASGGVAGALLGLSGARSGFGALWVLTATALALAGLDLLRVPVWQRNRETPRNWMDYPGAVWGLLNGGALGVGLITRIGFWSWWLVPAASLLSGSAASGAVIYGAYALSRALGVLGLAAVSIGRDYQRPALWLHYRRLQAQQLSAIILLICSVAAIVLGSRFWFI